MDTEIIGVGSELLLGQIANTDAQYISQKLSQLGINVFYHTVVGDNRERLMRALETASNRANLIITTGGLGPTMDDITKEVVADFLNLPMVLHRPSLDSIESFFAQRRRQVSENNYRQAYFPKEAIVLPNSQGTAPGAIIEAKDHNIYIILPGPPRELKPMFEDQVIPYLEEKSDTTITSRVLKIFGMGESDMEVKIKDILENQGNPTIAPLAGASELTLRITARTPKGEDPYKLIGPVEECIRQRLGHVVYGKDRDTIESVVVRLLGKYGKSLALAESCTGGMIAERITSVAGASLVFKEGVVTYSNQSKVDRLNVSTKTLDTYGAVSRETAMEMVKGIIKTSRASIGAAVTGIAGPGGGTEEKPVGLVYIAVGESEGKIIVEEYNFLGNRERIQRSATLSALDLIRKMLLKLI